MNKLKLITILIIAVILLSLFVFLENAKNNDRLRKHDDPGMNTENNTIDAPSGNTAEPLPVKPVPVLVINAGGKTFYASFEDNSSAKAFIEKLSSEPLSIELHDYGNFEKVQNELPRRKPGFSFCIKLRGIVALFMKKGYTYQKVSPGKPGL